MSADRPRISVLMPVYNAAEYLDQAIESIVNQTFKNWQMLIADDASTDSSPEIIAAWQKRDQRIKAIFGKTNKGQAQRLNQLANRSQSEYLAIQDADDLSLANRLELQIETISQRKLDLLGTFGHRIDSQNQIIAEKQQPVTQAQIISKLSWGNPFIHTSIMIRRKVFQKQNGYSDLSHAQDYEFWSRLLLSGYRAENIPKFLVQTRQHPNQKSQTGRLKQLKTSASIAYSNYCHWHSATIGQDQFIQVYLWKHGWVESVWQLPRIYWWFLQTKI